MARNLISLLAVALCCAPCLGMTHTTTLEAAAQQGTQQIVVMNGVGFQPGMNVRLTDGGDSEVTKITAVDGGKVDLEAPLTRTYPVGAQAVAEDDFVTTTVPTTTLTGYDSSASSGSYSLESANSASLHTGSSGSDFSSSGSSGSTASGSWGSTLELWQWLIVACLACLCYCGIAGAMSMQSKKKTKKSKKKSPAAPAPVSAPSPAPAATEAVAEPLMMPPTEPLISPLGLPPLSPTVSTYTGTVSPTFSYPAVTAPQPMYNPARLISTQAGAPAAGGAVVYRSGLVR